MLSSSRDNWERLVTAVVRREELWQLFHEQSRTPSVCSVSSDEEIEEICSASSDEEIEEIPNSVNQDVSFHGPERVRVRQYGKSVKELTALYKSQEIQAHNGLIWAMKFSLDGKYLASAGEDCVIHVWQVVERERKGDFLFDKSGDRNFGGQSESKRRGRLSIGRKSVSVERVTVPEMVFALLEKPVCSFQGHLSEVLDLSWSKSQQLLSSSMDKTVRLWDLSSKSCLKIFSHNNYVTFVQFNPVDDRYFISGSIDGKVRIWSIPDQQVVDWNDLRVIVTAACYTPDGQGAVVGSLEGSCRFYNTSENKLLLESQVDLQNKKKRSHQKKINGFQFAPGNTSEVLVTTADSRIRVIDGVDIVHKFKGFHSTHNLVSASLTSNGKYVVSASEDSYVCVWRYEGEYRPNRSKSVKTTRSYERFHCQDVAVAIPWPGMSDTCDEIQNETTDRFEASTVHHPTTPLEEKNGSKTSAFLTESLPSRANSYLFDRTSAAKSRSPRVSVDFSNVSAWGMVIVTAGFKGEIKIFQNFGLPFRI